MANKSITCWWPTMPKPGNMGDIITPVLLKKIFNINPEWKHIKHMGNREPYLLCVGSIAGKADKPNGVIWSSGLMSKGAANNVHEDVKILAVRGPLTRKALLDRGFDVPEILGDAGLLVPRLYDCNDVEKKYKYGIIPHYVDYAEVSKRYKSNPDIKIINVLNSNPEIPIREICECEKTISSSLHGIIFSNAYNIPSTWVRFSNKLCGDDIKFHDYFTFCNQTFDSVPNGMIGEGRFGKLKYITLENSKHHNPDQLIQSLTDWRDGNV